MGEFGVMIKGTGPGDYSGGQLGAEAESAILALLQKLESLGFKIGPGGAAIMAPDDQSGGTVENDVAAPKHQVPVEQGQGAYKCPACGLEYAYPGACIGGEYQHDPVALKTTAEVQAIAEQAKADAKAEADAAAAGTAAAPAAAAPAGTSVREISIAPSAAAQGSGSETAAPAEQVQAPASAGATEKPAEPTAAAPAPAQAQAPAQDAAPAQEAAKPVEPQWPSGT